MYEAVERYSPELIVAPMLKRAIPEDIWREHVCIIVHPGPKGDRGPSSLDWAILEGHERWGVTLAVVPNGDDAFHARLTSAGWTELFADADGWLLRAP